MINDEVRRHACAHARFRDNILPVQQIKLTIDDSQVSPTGELHTTVINTRQLLRLLIGRV